MGDFAIETSPGEVSLRGEFDLGNVEDLRAALATAGESPDGGITVHLGELTFIDSSGLNELIRPVQQGRRVELRSCPEKVRRLLQVTGFETVLEIVD